MQKLSDYSSELATLEKEYSEKSNRKFSDAGRKDLEHEIKNLENRLSAEQYPETHRQLAEGLRFLKADQAVANLGWRGERKVRDLYKDLFSSKNREDFDENAELGDARYRLIAQDALEERNADFWQGLKLRGPSYLAHVIGGALLGRLIAGKKYRWWGYSLGGAAGLLANYARRKSYYGGNITV